ncbi:MAG: transglutaminase domain-containing protein [Clostridia bacterium]
MKIKDIRRDKSNYKKINDETDIDEIIERPLREAVKDLFRKNIITIMSSANEINVQWLDENGNNMYQTREDFDAIKYSYGEGFAYIILDYDSLSDKNKKIIDDLYNELNPQEEQQIYTKPITAEQSYKGNKRIIYAIHQVENPGHAWQIDSENTLGLLTGTGAEVSDMDFMRKSNFVYTTPYTERSVIIRYPVNEETEEGEVEEFFSSICSKLENQERRISINDAMQNETQFSDLDKSSLQEIAKAIFTEQHRKVPLQPYTRHILLTEQEKKEIIARYIKAYKDFTIELIKKQINEDMTDEQKYKVIFDCFVNRYKYDYSILDTEIAFEYFRKAFSSYRNILRPYIKNIENYSQMSHFEQVHKILEQIPTDESHEELLELMKSAEEYYSRANEFKKNNKNYRYGNLYITKYGVCQNFATAFKEMCDAFGLPSEIIGGHILSGDANVGHAWNAIMVNGDIRYVDISSAIHSKDGTYPNNTPEDFFDINEQELDRSDNGKNRTLSEESKAKIVEMKKRIHSFDPSGSGTKSGGHDFDDDTPSLS